MYRKHRKLAAALVALIAMPGPARAEFPERPIQFVVPFPAGGTLDIVARKFAESFAEAVGQPVVVTNRDGASGVIGTQVVSQASPDGYTLVFDANGPLTVQPSLHKTTYNVSSFRPVCQVFSYSYALAVPENSPINSLGDFVAKAKGGTIKYAFGGVGTAPQFAALQLSQAARIKLLAVPYRGDPPAAVGLKGGDVDAAILTAEIARQQNFKILAAFADKRLPVMPNVPTAREQGFDVIANTTAGLLAPVNIHDDVAKKLDVACQETVKNPKFVAGMQLLEQDIAYLPSDKFGAALAADTAVKRQLIETSGIKQEK
jgi:tripartite-type tricarboxylate transporter receptor subunit TctC